MAYITCRNLSLGYDGKEIISNLNFEVNKGDYLCVVGENGAGKSTLMKTLLHLQNPISGEMIIEEGMKPYEIGYLPQQTPVQKDFPATVWEVVLSGNLSKCGKRPFYRTEEKSNAEDKMKQLDIWEIRKKSYRDLSGGQQQRVLLARALCATSKILLLDEPVTGLDPLVTGEFYEIVKKLNEEGVTIIMVSHDMKSVEYATHVLHMDRMDSFFGTKGQYLHSEKGKQFQMLGGHKMNTCTICRFTQKNEKNTFYQDK